MGYVDLETTLKNFDGDLELFEAISRIYLEDAPVLVSELTRHVRAGNQVGISEVLHKLKGLVANFHASQLVNQLEAGETAAKEGRGAIDQTETALIAKQIDQIGGELTSFLAANKKG